MNRAFLVFIFTGIMCSISLAQALELRKTDVSYANYLVEVYDGQNGGSLPFKVSLNWVVGGCSSSVIKALKLDLVTFNDTYLFKMENFAPAIVCDMPNKILTQTFEFPKGKGFADLIVPTDVEVKVERSN